MAIQVVPHCEALSPAVQAFNQRMRDGGSPWGFYPDPVPDWIPKREGVNAWREYHLAVEDGNFVRGAYALKPQEWLVNGETEIVTDWQGPFTEGAVNPRYATLGLRLIRDMLKKYPLLYSVGHGGSEEPVVQLLRSLGWTLYEMPFCLRVLQPYRFLRKNRYLRERPKQALALDALAFSGAGALGLRALHRGLRWRHGTAASGARAVVVEAFGPWADMLWARHKDRYRCLALRDAAMMNRLLPPSGWPGGTRLMIERGGDVIGWSVVHHKQMTDDRRFGSLHVGMVTDCYAAPEDSAAVIQATDAYLTGQRVDLIYSNQSHPEWVKAFRQSGYVILNNRRIFAMSPQLKERLNPFEQTIEGLHLTNLDGHGPHGFEA